MKFRIILVAISCLLIALISAPHVALSQSEIPSTSPTVNDIAGSFRALTANADVSNVITFSEYPLGTAISNQYANQGIIFGGDNPFISQDGANPTSPVLSGTPRFQGAIEGRFVDPTDGSTPTIVHSFSLDAGYFDEYGSTRIEWFDPNGNKLGQRTNTTYGIERFQIQGGNIASWRISIIENEPAGYAIDNVSFESAQASVLFREKSGDEKDGTWGLLDSIPGFDHSALNIGDLVYESHPAYPSGTYYSEDGSEAVNVQRYNGVQAQFTKATFKHDAKSPGAENSPVIDFEEIPIDGELAEKMRDHIESQIAIGAEFQFIDYSPQGLVDTLSPSAQKGGNGTFTCVGLIEWSAEQAGHNGGQGFVQNHFESIGDFPLLSPRLLNWAMKSSPRLENAKQWYQAFFDPVDFLITDPLGRRLGYTDESGEVNEVPGAFYSGNGTVEQLLIPNPVAGNYQIEFIGLGDRVYGAMASSQHSEEVDMFLAQDEKAILTFNVELLPGAPGDVTRDGTIDAQDEEELSSNLNTFTNDPNDPSDIDGDGLISQADLVLLRELINGATQKPPTADLSGPYQTTEGQLVILDASGSFDSDGNIVLYEWDIDNDGQYDDATGVTTEVAFGDNGTFTVGLKVTDNAGASDTDTTEVVIDNVAPAVTLNIQESYPFAGGNAFLGRKNVEQFHQATATDPGSDDLTFNWNTGTMATYFNDGTAPDPESSPSGTFPFEATDTTSVTFTDPGIYTIGVDVTDDDGGTASASLPKVITNNQTCTLGQGFWKHQFGTKGKHQVDDTNLGIYLSITGFASAVFSEQVAANTISEAREVMWVLRPRMRDHAEAQLLAAWMNFSQGAVGWEEMIDTNGDRTGDLAFHELIATAEGILLNPKATHGELVHAKDLAETVNLRDARISQCKALERAALQESGGAIYLPLITGH